MGFGEIFFKATGLMTKKQILANCRKIGTNVAEIAHNSDGHISPEQLRSVYEQVLDKRCLRKMDLCCTKQEFIAQFQKRGCSTQELEEIEKYYETTAGGVIFGKRPIVNLPVDRLYSINVVDTVTHETEHALSNTFTLKEKLIRFLRKCGIDVQKSDLPHDTRQNLEQSLIRNIGNIRESAMGCTRGKKGLAGILESSNSANETELLSKIKGEIYSYATLDKESPRKNLKKLLNLKRFFEEEYRAYSAGAEAANYWLDNCTKIKFTNQISKSEIISNIYAEVLKVINSEIKLSIKNIV